LSNLDKAVIDL